MFNGSVPDEITMREKLKKEWSGILNEQEGALYPSIIGRRKENPSYPVFVPNIPNRVEMELTKIDYEAEERRLKNEKLRQEWEELVDKLNELNFNK